MISSENLRRRGRQRCGLEQERQVQFLKRLNFEQYPRQFRLMFWGMMLSTLGTSMIWPFLMIYVSEKLSLPLAAVATLLTDQFDLCVDIILSGRSPGRPALDANG